MKLKRALILSLSILMISSTLLAQKKVAVTTVPRTAPRMKRPNAVSMDRIIEIEKDGVSRAANTHIAEMVQHLKQNVVKM